MQAIKKKLKRIIKLFITYKIENDTNVFCYNMQKHCGEELTVRHISENGRYVLTDNEGSGTRELYMWSWSEWMFEERK